MAVLTPKTLFVHVGRTGGHWVSHVLWRSGLMVDRLWPLHLRPSELASRPEALERPFWFCFVRHPLPWLRSLWVHAWSYGLTDPTLGSTLAANFPEFLERLLEAHPRGIATERLAPYVDGVHFVGRTERLAADLVAALERGGETFDPRHAELPAINAGDVGTLVAAARAPRALLDAVLERDTAFARRFGYEGVPEAMIDETAPRVSVVPGPRWRGEEPTREAVEAAVFDLPVTLPGRSAPAAVPSTIRQLWGVQAGLAAISDRESKRLLYLPAGDGVGAHLAAAMGFRSVDALDSDRRASFDLVSRLSADRVTWHDAQAYPFGERRFDAVLCADFGIARAPQLTLSILTSLLVPGGEAVLRILILNTEDDLPLTLALSPRASLHGPLIGNYVSLAALRGMMEAVGLHEVDVVDEYHDKGDPDAEPRKRVLSGKLGIDPDLLTSAVTLRAMYRPEDSGVVGVTPGALEDAWLRRRHLWFADPINNAAYAPLTRLAAGLQGRIEEYERTLAVLHSAIADRDLTLTAERSELGTRRHQVEASRENLRRWRDEIGHLLDIVER